MAQIPVNHIDGRKFNCPKLPSQGKRRGGILIAARLLPDLGAKFQAEKERRGISATALIELALENFLGDSN
jgi:hypothetical protein